MGNSVVQHVLTSTVPIVFHLSGRCSANPALPLLVQCARNAYLSKYVEQVIEHFTALKHPALPTNLDKNECSFEWQSILLKKERLIGLLWDYCKHIQLLSSRRQRMNFNSQNPSQTHSQNQSLLSDSNSIEFKEFERSQLLQPLNIAVHISSANELNHFDVRNTFDCKSFYKNSAKQSLYLLYGSLKTVNIHPSVLEQLYSVIESTVKFPGHLIARNSLINRSTEFKNLPIRLYLCGFEDEAGEGNYLMFPIQRAVGYEKFKEVTLKLLIECLLPHFASLKWSVYCLGIKLPNETPVMYIFYNLLSADLWVHLLLCCEASFASISDA